MTLKMGEMNELVVLRESDIAYVLNTKEEEVFLHKKQTFRAKIEKDDMVNVFLYFDNQKRITATLKEPYIDVNRPGFVKVVDTNYHLGAFLDIGTIKDLLLSRDDLPMIKAQWPKVGDELFVRIKISKNQMTGKIIPRHSISEYLTPDTRLELNEKYEAFVVYLAEEGVVFTTKEGHVIFVYFKHLRKTYRLGEKAEVKILVEKGGYKYNGTLIEQKEIMIDKDAAYIKEYLENKGGVMPFGDKSDIEEIKEVFNMSKSAFKRALGVLYKAKVVNLEKFKTTLIKEELDTEDNNQDFSVDNEE